MRLILAPHAKGGIEMMRMIGRGASLLCVALAVTPGLAQSRPASAAVGEVAAFEIADVHSSPHRTNPSMRGGLLHGEQYVLRDATMVDLMAIAYKVDPTNVQGGPPWIEFDRYDIFAKAPNGTSRDAIALLVRGLLAERFKLAAHADVKPLPAFVLSVGKSPKLKQADDFNTPEGCDYRESPKDATPAMRGVVSFSCHNTTMQSLVEFLRDVASPYLTKPVVDSTGLKGGWDFDLRWTYRPTKSGDGIAIFDAVEKQLGLKLEAKTAPQPVVAIDSVNEKPTPNRADLDKVLPPLPPAAFEVAVVRLANPDETHFSVEISDGGKVDLQYATLQTLITFAWDIGPGKLVGAPKWLNDDHYDVLGKASIDAPSGNPMALRELDIDDVKEMLRSLLADRFKMTSHMEERPVDAYSLIASNPKMKKADPANHTSCKEGPGADGKDPRLDNPLLTRLISCQNITMAQFSQEIATLVSGYVKGLVIDSTGLSDAYDFTLSFSKQRDLRNGGAPSADDSAATDPSGAISLFDAMNKQLGIKLVKKEKIPVPMLVIDHIEPKPTEN